MIRVGPNVTGVLPKQGEQEHGDGHAQRGEDMSRHGGEGASQDDRSSSWHVATASQGPQGLPGTPEVGKRHESDVSRVSQGAQPR